TSRVLRDVSNNLLAQFPFQISFQCFAKPFRHPINTFKYLHLGGIDLQRKFVTLTFYELVHCCCDIEVFLAFALEEFNICRSKARSVDTSWTALITTTGLACCETSALPRRCLVNVLRSGLLSLVLLSCPSLLLEVSALCFLAR